MEARGDIESGRSWGCTALNDSHEGGLFGKYVLRDDIRALVPAFSGRGGVPNAIRAIDLEGDFRKILNFLAWLRFPYIADFASLDASLG